MRLRGRRGEIETPEKPTQLKKRVLGDSVKEQTPAKKQTILNPIQEHLDLLQLGKNAFRLSSVPLKFVGRETQQQAIEDFFQAHIGKKKPGSLYVAGAPGTGKTALIESLLEDYQSQVRVISVNCMTCPNANKIFPTILKKLDPALKVSGTDKAVKEVEEHLLSGKKFNVLFLDEIDQLITKDQETLYRIFEWPALKGSRVVIVGIANSLDLTDRFLPRLRTHGAEPQLLSFPAYTASDISAILQYRLKHAVGDKWLDIVEKIAFEACAKKLQALGDLRKAMDVFRLAFTEAERSTRDLLKNEASNPFVDSPLAPKSTGKAVMLHGTFPKVTLRLMLTVLDNTFGGGNPTVQKIQKLTSHQKAALVSIVLLGKKNGLADMTLKALYEHYITICRKEKAITELPITAFNDVIMACETVGLMEIRHITNKRLSGPAKPSPSRKLLGSATKASPFSSSKNKDATRCVVLHATEDDVKEGIKDMPFLLELLE